MDKHEFNKRLEENKKTAKKLAVGFIAVLLLLFVIVVFASISKPTKTVSNSVSREKTYKYEELARVEDNTDENISVLIDPNEKDPKSLAAEVQKSCSKKCNISLYDDKKAFELYQQYDGMISSLNTEQSEIDNWKKNNYVFVADHLVGTVGYSFGDYDDYPLRDWYYKELKGE